MYPCCSRYFFVQTHTPTWHFEFRYVKVISLIAWWRVYEYFTKQLELLPLNLWETNLMPYRHNCGVITHFPLSLKKFMKCPQVEHIRWYISMSQPLEVWDVVFILAIGVRESYLIDGAKFIFQFLRAISKLPDHPRSKTMACPCQKQKKCYTQNKDNILFVDNTIVLNLLRIIITRITIFIIWPFIIFTLY